MKILLAEDNPLNQEMLSELLENWGHTVALAENGQQALDRMEADVPDLVLLDLQMPVLDGYAVLSRIRQNPKLNGVPVLAVTAYAMAGDREKAISAGFNGYVTKPIESAQLKAEIARVKQ
ncbi:MAG TPA: response regulator [Terriglobales bacterium]|nr:response regulator [Terriglobales bacterium]